MTNNVLGLISFKFSLPIFFRTLMLHHESHLLCVPRWIIEELIIGARFYTRPLIFAGLSFKSDYRADLSKFQLALIDRCNYAIEWRKAKRVNYTVHSVQAKNFCCKIVMFLNESWARLNFAQERKSWPQVKDKVIWNKQETRKSLFYHYRSQSNRFWRRQFT